MQLLKRAVPLTVNPSQPHQRLWLWLSFLVSLLFGSLAIFHAFSHEYVIQDDARHHVFWMHRFLDPELFPNDIVADYFQTVAPLGYVYLYKFFSLFHIDPIVVNKLLPLGLGLVMTGYCFGVCMELLPIPVAGFISALILNELVWAEDNLNSATPRAFVYPIFLGFMYYFMRRSLWPCLGMIVLQGLFYPQYALIIIAFLLIHLFSNFSSIFKQKTDFSLNQNKKDFKLCASGIILAGTILLIFKLTSSGFGPVVTLTEAKQMIEFTNTGRFPFFDDNPWCFWLAKKNSGLLAAYNATRDCEFYVGAFPLGFPPLIWASLCLPFLVIFKSRLLKNRSEKNNISSHSPKDDQSNSLRYFLRKLSSKSSSELSSKSLNALSSNLSNNLAVLVHIFWASLILFCLAHSVLLTLHLPARYTVHSFRLLMALSAGLSITLIWRLLVHFLLSYPASLWLKVITYSCLTVFLLLAIAFPLLSLDFAKKSVIEGQEPELYEFLSTQPKDVIIASLSEEADNIPIFSKRSVLVNRENAIPFHRGFYDEFSQRAHDLLEAQYTHRPQTLKHFIETYHIDLWVVDNDAYEPTYLDKKWVQQYQPTFRKTRRQLAQDQSSVLSKSHRLCTIFEGRKVTVLEAQCIVKKE